MGDLTALTDQEIRDAVINIRERAEKAEDLGQYSTFFVDANILNILLKKSNQIIYGRRGTGKTHLLHRIKEHYRDSFDKNKILPVYVDVSTFKETGIGNIEKGIILFIAYRRFLSAIIQGIEAFLDHNMTPKVLDRIWPRTKTQQKIRRVKELITKLEELVHFGQIEVGGGRVLSQQSDKSTRITKNQRSVDVLFSNSVREQLAAKADLKLSLSNISAKRADESLKVIYEGLTVLNIPQISEYLDEIQSELSISNILILMDEWTRFDHELQPLLAEMIRTTLQGRIIIKFACYPFSGNFSASTEEGQTIGLPIGEELFVDIDLDRYYNAYVDPESTTVFLLRVLQKHLGYSIDSMLDAPTPQAFQFFHEKIFKDPETLKELVLASAGIPRDFLRIFTQAVLKEKCQLPLKIDDIKLATHEYFQEEKYQKLEADTSQLRLYEDIFKKVLLGINSYVFFVSSPVGKNRILQDLYQRRLIHLVFQGHIGYSGTIADTYDVYAMDYGKFLIMSSVEKARGNLEKMKSFSISYLYRIANSKSRLAGWSRTYLNELESVMSVRFVTSVNPQHPDTKALFDDCSSVVIDDLIKALPAVQNSK